MTQEVAYFALLAVIVNLSVVALHVLRERITLGPLFALAGALTLLLWQFLYLGWWITWHGLNINGPVQAIVPALVGGAVLCYALDGLRTARAYLLVVAVSAAIAFGAAQYRSGLALLVPLPYSIVFSPEVHLALAIAVVGGGAIAMVAFELLRRLTLAAAPPLAVLIGVIGGGGLRALVEYGGPVGWLSFRGEAAELILAAALTALVLLPHWLWAIRRHGTMPVRSLRDLLSFWKRAESSLREAQEDVVNARRTISELRSLNTRLAESERLREYQMQNSPFGIVHATSEFLVTRGNRAAGEILGCDPAMLPGQDLGALLARQGIDPGLLPALAATPSGQVVQSAVAGAETRAYELQSTALEDHQGRPVAYTILIKDVTERERANRRRLVGARVRGLHETGRVIAHDFSNLILGAQSQLETLDAALAGGDVATAQRASALVVRSLAHGREMLAQLGAGQVLARPELRSIDLASLATEALDVCAHGATRKGVRLTFTEPAGPIYVEADATQILRVMTNLVNNAVRATPKGRAVELGVFADGSGGSVFVSDEGEGMSEAQIARAFDPEYSTKEGGQGGLGLAISYLIVDAHGGAIRLVRGPRGGLVATFWLPGAAAPAVQEDLAGKRVVIWLGSPEHASAAATRLEDLGAEAAEVLSGDELRALLAEQPGAWTALADASTRDSIAAVASIPVALLETGAAAGSDAVAELAVAALREKLAAGA
jgi:PAS domain S-box-containing protein